MRITKPWNKELVKLDFNTSANNIIDIIDIIIIGLVMDHRAILMIGFPQVRCMCLYIYIYICHIPHYGCVPCFSGCLKAMQLQPEESTDVIWVSRELVYLIGHSSLGSEQD